MRFALIALLVVFAVLPFASSQAQGQSSNPSGAIFSGFYCRQRVPCDQSDPAFPQAAELATLGNNCLTQNIGISTPNGFFEEAAGIDSNGCLTTKTDAFPEVAGSRTVPQCCVKAVPQGGCAIHCDMLNQ